MGVDFTILQGFGYVIPENSLTEEEIGLLYDLSRKDKQFFVDSHGQYEKTDKSKIFICLKNEVDTIVEIRVSGDYWYAYNCQDFSVVCYHGKGSYTEYEQLLENKHLTLDQYLEESVPWLFNKIMENYRNYYDKWLFGFLH